MALFNLARMTVTSTGTGNITLNAAVSGFLTFDAAGCSTAATGQAVSYAIGDTTQSEQGSGTYYSSGPTLTRGSSTSGLKSTNSNSPINMTNAAQVIITPQAAGVIGRVNVQTFLTSTTWTPTTGLIVAVMDCVGGGGGGGGADGDIGLVVAGGGGGAGSWSRTVSLSSAVGTSQTVTIGSGGNGGAAGSNNGSAGSDTSIGVLCIGKGGSGGSFGANLAAPSGGAGGVAGTGTITSIGQSGGYGANYSTVVNAFLAGGAGGNSLYGAGAAGVSFGTGVTPVTGSNATANTGGGGAGGASYNENTTAAGGNGGSGRAVVFEYCSL